MYQAFTIFRQQNDINHTESRHKRSASESLDADPVVGLVGMADSVRARALAG